MVLECSLSAVDEENALELVAFPWLDDEPPVDEFESRDLSFISEDEEDGFWGDDDNYLF